MPEKVMTNEELTEAVHGLVALNASANKALASLFEAIQEVANHQIRQEKSGPE